MNLKSILFETNKEETTTTTTTADASDDASSVSTGFSSIYALALGPEGSGNFFGERDHQHQRKDHLQRLFLLSLCLES
jgi:hypothetical protein